MELAHKLELSIVQSSFKESADGVDITLLIRLSCRQFCDFTGKTVILTPDFDEDAEPLKIEFTKHNGAETETEAIHIKTKSEPGTYTWTATVADFEDNGVLHEAVSDIYTFVFAPHSAHTVVWDIPAIIYAGTPFKLKAGLKCSTGCDLSGNTLEIIAENKVYQAELGTKLWKNTASLYWTEFELTAPELGLHTWRLQYPGTAMHPGATSEFTFKTINQPECTLTVTVQDADTGAPIPDIMVTVHPYNIRTSAEGMAIFELAKGEYPMYVSGNDLYERYGNDVDIVGDAAMRVKLKAIEILDQDS